MNESLGASLWEPLQRFLDRAAGLLPVLLAVLIVLIAGLVLAWVVSGLVRAVLRALQFDRLGRGPRVSEGLRRAGLYLPPSDLVAQMVRWFLVVAALVGALSILNTEATDAVIAAMVHYLPSLAAGLLLLVLGYAVGTFAARSVLLWAVNAQVRGARWLAGGVQVLVGVFFAALALEHLGFGREISLVVLAIMLGGGALAAAIAFGLAGKDLARQALDQMMEGTRDDDRDTISHL
ncbi:MAG TPA: hypothetical protein VFM17_08165 [Candidatus Eisenbacteria bacterium]|jgi:hypothetical protein|nr:hypothetical protein [Candidatus Eisenbacteria bacterium]